MPVSRILHQLKLCRSKTQSPITLKQLHTQVIKLGLLHYGPIPNTLLDVYAKCGFTQHALQLFDEMPHRDQVTWASILTAYTQSNNPSKTLSVFPLMLSVDGLEPDHFVFSSLVKACANLGDVRRGREVHGHFVLSPFVEDDVVKSSLVDMYAKCGLPDDAHAVFDSIRVRNMISWNAIVSAYARSGRKVEALDMFGRVPVKSLFLWTALVSGLVQSGNGIDAIGVFIDMRRDSVDIVDPLVLSSVVGACADLALLEFGKQIHGLVVALGYESCLFISNAIVDMYAKCSDILAAKLIFAGMQRRDVVSWTSMIVGAAQHGRAEEALGLYDEMVLTGVKPNEVTFVGLIYACSHAGLVNKGRELFKSMTESYGVKPSLLHYTCLLDLLSRSGHLDEAEKLIFEMPFTPDEPTWAALLSACKHYNKAEMAVRIANHLLRLKPKDPSTYILLSNIYAGSLMWEQVSNVRKIMSTMEVRKEPGYSCIEFGKDSHVFYAGETTHPIKEEIFDLLTELDIEMKKKGYVPDTNLVLYDMEDQEKERQLFWHSERLAVAYGLLKAVPGSVIRIVKNLRVCGDCHTVLKLISSITKREIVVRDATRYHHFKDGKCSCSDFW